MLIHTIKRCTQTLPSGCILSESCDCSNLRLEEDLLISIITSLAQKAPFRIFDKMEHLWLSQISISTPQERVKVIAPFR